MVDSHRFLPCYISPACFGRFLRYFPFPLSHQPLVLTLSPDRLRDRTESTVARHLQRYCRRPASPTAEKADGHGAVVTGTASVADEADCDADADADADGGASSAADVSSAVALLSQLITQRLTWTGKIGDVCQSSGGGDDCDTAGSLTPSLSLSLSLDRVCAVVGAMEEAWARMQSGSGTRKGQSKGSAVGLLPLPPHPVRAEEGDLK